MAVMGLIARNDYKTRVKIRRWWSVISPLATSMAYFQNPVWMLTIGNLFKTIKFPLMAGGAIYLHYRHLDKRVQPGWKADALLMICAGIMVFLALYIIHVKRFLW